MKRILAILTAFALLALTACGTKAPADADYLSALDTQKEVLLTLGMTQADLEGKLGTALEQDPAQEGYYPYPGAGEGDGTVLLLENGILQGITIQNPALKLQGGFGVGSLISQLGDGWSLIRISDTVDCAFRYFDGEGNLLLEATVDAVVMQTLTFYDGSEAAGEAGLYSLN